MAMRKFLADKLLSLATAIEQDTSKEKVQAAVIVGRRKLADWIQPETRTVTGEQLFKFMGTFSNKDLADAQTIAEHAHKDLGRSYNQTLVDVLLEMRKAELAS